MGWSGRGLNFMTFKDEKRRADIAVLQDLLKLTHNGSLETYLNSVRKVYFQTEQVESSAHTIFSLIPFQRAIIFQDDSPAHIRPKTAIILSHEH